MFYIFDLILIIILFNLMNYYKIILDKNFYINCEGYFYEYFK